MDRHAYSARLVTASLRIIGAVHDENPAQLRDAIADARSIVPPRGVDGEDALIVTLAALCDTSKTRNELLAWVNHTHVSLADLYPTAPHYYRVNQLAVEMGITGALPAAALNPAELELVAHHLRNRGMTPADIARHLDTEPCHLPRTLHTPAKIDLGAAA